MERDTALCILRLYDDAGSEAWDLHAFFELAAGDDPVRRESVMDVVEELVAGGYLESRGSDFYTATEKGLRAAKTGLLANDGEISEADGCGNG